MNKLTLSFLTLTTAAALTVSAQAHDPKEHMADAEKPDCAAMKDMDHSKMDMNDPVTMAMMKQCKDAKKADCAAMKDMDHSKMDMNDPANMAMMKKCKDASHTQEHSQDGHDQDQSKHHDNKDLIDSSADETPDL